MCGGPPGGELRDAVNAAVLPEALARDVAATPSRSASATGRSAGGGLPLERWRRDGMPPPPAGRTQRWQLFRIAASGCARGWDPEETFRAMREVADRTELLRPDEPWEDWDLRRMVASAIKGKARRDERDAIREAETTREILAVTDIASWKPAS